MWPDSVGSLVWVALVAAAFGEDGSASTTAGTSISEATLFPAGKDDDGGKHLYYSCPPHVTKSQNDFDDYWTTYHEMNQENLQDLIHFRDRGYDYRSDSYSSMKVKTAAFKSQYFGSVLQSGDHIYESACGEGLNLLMTLETLKECCNIVNVTVHGNDYLADSVLVAQRIYQQELASSSSSSSSSSSPMTGTADKDWFRVGRMCQGDSTNLGHVPSDAFDLAYTGFIDPLLDPLELMDASASLDAREEMVEEICHERNNDPQVADIANRMQRIQEDWHAKWVTELVRIVKPGKYVIIEDVGWPACSLITEWGGVDTEWWIEAVERYGWDVDVESVEIFEEDPYAWYDNRYNVRMMKKKKKQAYIVDDDSREEQ